MKVPIIANRRIKGDYFELVFSAPEIAAAAALILFAIVFTITYINLTFSKNKVQYM